MKLGNIVWKDERNQELQFVEDPKGRHRFYEREDLKDDVAFSEASKMYFDGLKSTPTDPFNKKKK